MELSESISGAGDDPIVVFGGGFAGLAAAYALARRVPEREILTVSGQAECVYRPSLPRVALRRRTLPQLRVDVGSALARRGVRFRCARVVGIDPAQRVLRTDGGPVRYAVLVAACGSEIAFDEVPGLARWGHVLCEADRIVRLREDIDSFRGGTVVVALSRENPYEIVDLGFVAELSDHLERRGLRDKSRILYLTPHGDVVPFLGARARGVIRGALLEHGVEIVPGAEVAAVEPGAVRLADGSRVASALTVLFPPYRGRACLRHPGLTNGRGFLLVDERLRSPTFPEVYGAGDCVSGDGSKSGRRAVAQAKAVAQEIAGRDSVADDRQPPLAAIVELGSRRAAYVRSRGPGAEERILAGALPSFLKTALEQWFLLRRGDI
ncbi:MAG: FAD-dependent oxidoreductase [Deltaproteobacteria bacterium]|nr:FAD-dependent oxidoreductase [Deltaproteobacteria bacterium]